MGGDIMRESKLNRRIQAKFMENFTGEDTKLRLRLGRSKQKTV